MGYSRNLKLLWSELDSDGNGFITLDELEPEAAVELDRFRQFLIDKFGNTLKAWKALDSKGGGRLDEHAFEEQCRAIGYAGMIKKLFVWLKGDLAKSFITVEDLDRRALSAMHRKDSAMISTKQTKMLVAANQGSKSLPDLHEGNKPKGPVATMSSSWTLAQSTEQLRLAREARLEREKKDMSTKTLAGLKRWLVTKYGSLYAAWRQALDLDGNGRLSFGEFCLALREQGYMGNMKATWVALDLDKDGFISLGELDPKTEKDISSYRELVGKKYDNALAAWLQGLAKGGAGGSGHVDFSTFAEHCKDIGFEGDVSTLFENLKNDNSRRFMTLQDYDIRAFNAFNRADYGMLSEETSSPKALTMDFQERQQNTFRARWDRMEAKAVRDGLAEAELARKKADKGAGDLNSLRALLMKKYGTLTAAWKHGLDYDGNGRLSFGEFCQALRAIGYNGCLKKVWQEMDSDGSGFITLDEIDPNAHKALNAFRKLLTDLHGSTMQAWFALDTNRNGWLEEDEFVVKAKEVGYDGNAHQLFRYILDRPGARWITMSDLDPEAMKEHYRGHIIDIRKQVAQDKAEEKSRDKCANTYADLKRLLIQKYGTMTAAWRHGLDFDGNGRLSFGEFCFGVRQVGFNGNLKKLWDELDADSSGFISLQELDRRAHKAMTSFHELLVEKFGNKKRAWKQLDQKRNGWVEEGDFVNFAQSVGYDGDPYQLFKYHLDKPGCRWVTMGDFDSSIVADEMRGEDVDVRRELERAKKEHKGKNKGASDWASMKTLLLKKYGTVSAAWKHGLDLDGNGKLSFGEFCDACRQIGYIGDLKALFTELDTHKTGLITMDEVDPDAKAALSSFRTLVLDTYGNLEEAWKAFDKDGNLRLDENEFSERCSDMGYEGDALALFKYLLDEKGARLLTIDHLQYWVNRKPL
mmetsp:Transcript_95536/g.212502  ORF Transcript_95536/g.212502 Transcript_95536/m.212502 type:complete len:921 (+) Transcript_95536:1-2763(+)